MDWARCFFVRIDSFMIGRCKAFTAQCLADYCEVRTWFSSVDTFYRRGAPCGAHRRALSLHRPAAGPEGDKVQGVR